MIFMIFMLLLNYLLRIPFLYENKNEILKKRNYELQKVVRVMVPLRFMF